MTLRHFIALFPLVAVAACSKPLFPTYPDGYREFAYIANSGGNSVTILDLVYLRPDRTLSVGSTPVALAASPTRNEVYVLNAQPGQASGSISVIDTTHNTVAGTLAVPRNPTAFTVDSTGQRAYVASTGANSVSVVDLAARRILETLPTGDKPSAAVIAPDGRSLVVPNRASGTVSVYGTIIPAMATKTTAAPAPPGAPMTLRATFPGCPGASDAVILPYSTKAFVACSAAHQVLVISLATNPTSTEAKQDPTSLTDHALALLDVGRDPTWLTLKPDGGEIFVSNHDSDSISEINTQTNEVGSTYAIGNQPAHGVVSGDGSALWVSNLGAESVSLYSIADGKFLSSLRTGMAPDTIAFSADEHLLVVADTRSADVSLIRTAGKLGPALFTILPAGADPSAIAIKAMPLQPQP